MKTALHFVSSIFLTLSLNTLQAQVPSLWGMTSEGGADEVGTIFRTDFDGTNLTVKHNFSVVNAGARPYVNAQLLQLSNGKLYGVTSDGGINNVGVLFEYDPTTGVYTKKADFSNAVGRAPMGMLALAGNGKLYGLASSGGANNLGTIYEFDLSTNVLSKKIDLVQANGHTPYGNSLFLHTNGKFYGMTVNGGNFNFGVIFEYDPASNTYIKKIDFGGSTNGAHPYGSLLMTNAGKVFGMTSQGGANNDGTLFEYAPATNTLTKKFDFSTASGRQPYSTLVEANNNLLYGVTAINGSLFEYNPTTNSVAKKVDFITNSNGVFPYGTLAKGSNGKLYGVTSGGGSTGHGVLYEYDISTNTYTKKFDFVMETGSSPYGGLTLSANGNLYGLTYQGGLTGGQGVLYEYNPATNTYTKKIDLEQTPDGSYPFGGLTQAANKKLYGMAISGGTTNAGVLFEIDPVSGVFAKRHEFIRDNGTFPQGNLTPAPNGKLYGMTAQGGATDDGVIFEFDPITGTYTVKFEFDYDNGAEPFGSLTLGSNNKFYGMTSEGGTSGYGVIFEYDPASNVFTKKTEFDNLTIGFNPYDALIEVGNGKFYGTCRDGGLNGNGLGTLFEYDLATNTITKKVNFFGAVGEGPEGSLVKAPNGKLYGVTRYGGANSRGVLFEYDITTNTYTKKFDFGATATAPAEPAASLALSPNGKLYGSTLWGGTGNRGVIFEYDPATNVLTTKQSFTGANGAGLLFGRLLFVKGEQTITFNALADKLVNDAAFTLSATSSAPLPITYTSSNTSVATISGSTVTIVGAGTTNITASQAGDASYNPATDVVQSLTVNKLNQTITFTAIADKSIGDAPFTLTATSTSSLPVSFSTTSSKVTLNNAQVTLVSAGRVTITAAQVGNSNYSAATSVDGSFCIKPAKPTITVTFINTASPTLTSSAASGNQWYRNGVAIGGAMGTTYSATQAGVYKVQVTVDDCVSEFSTEQTLVVTGDLDHTQADFVEFYPNPVKDVLTVKLGQPNEKKVVEVYDLAGKPVEQRQVWEDHVQFEVGGWAGGLYLLKVKTGSSEKVYRFVKE